MALTTAQKLLIKKFFKLPPKDKSIDAWIANIEDGAEVEAEVVAALNAAQVAYTAWQTEMSTQDNLYEAGSPNGGIAKFALGLGAGFKLRAYNNLIDDLARLLDLPGWEYGGGVACIVGVPVL